MPRGRGRRSTRARKPAAPVQTYITDEEETEEPTAPQSPQSVQADPEEEEEVEEEPPAAQDEDDEDSEPAEAEAEDNSDHSSPPPVEVIPRKRRLGRPPKNRPPDWETPRRNDDDSAGTPRRGRGRGRGGYRGRGRGRKSMINAEPMIQQVKIDKEGTLADIVNDEVELPGDPEGEEKVDRDGILQGGREYRVRTFTITGRGERLYMLSTEPARCIGFRDSYLFFTKHMHLHKIIIDDDEKRDLITRDVIPHSYKGRSIGVCTARSVFREFGAKIVVGGKKVIDDYYAQAARDQGEIAGELADPTDRLPAEGEPYNRNQYVAWFGASQVYHQQPGPQVVNGKPILGKRKVAINSANWQAEHARAASRFNTFILQSRRAVADGVYDPHTNHMLYPKFTQPTHAKWSEEMDSELPPTKKRMLTNGYMHHETAASMTNGIIPHTNTTDTSSVFTPVPPKVARNFLISDVHYNSAPIAGFGIPGPDGDAMHVGPNGLPEVNDDLLADLPPECRAALEAAKAQEKEWKLSWRTELDDGGRRPLQIRYMGFPA